MYINNPGHMTKMAAMPIYCKNHSKIFSRTGGPISFFFFFYSSYLRATHLFSPSFDTQRVGEDHPPEYLTNYKGAFAYKRSAIVLHSSFTLHLNVAIAILTKTVVCSTMA